MPTEQKNIVPGDILEGKVQGITNFGAFVELPTGEVGLVHISEIADTYVKDVKDFIQEGDTVKVKVLNVAGKKIGLSIKQAMSPVTPPEKATGKGSGGSQEFGRSDSKNNPTSLDDKIAKFLKESDERMQPLRNRMEPRRRNRYNNY